MDSKRYFDTIECGDAAALRDLVRETPELLRATRTPAGAPEGMTGFTGLHAAVHTNDLECARVLLDAGVDLEAKTSEGRTALHDAIEFGRGGILELLLERGAEVDICSASILGRTQRVRELLDRDPELVNDRATGLSPLCWAAFGNQVEVARELIDRGARMDDGELLCAASVGHVEIGRLLIEQGADPNALHNESGANALHAAAFMKYAHDSRRFIEMLLEMGADAALRTRHGMTAHDIAARRAEEQQQALSTDPALRTKPFDEVAQMLSPASGA